MLKNGLDFGSFFLDYFSFYYQPFSPVTIDGSAGSTYDNEKLSIILLG